MVTADKGYHADTRIAVSKHTLQSLKARLRGGETYDTLIRRMLVSGIERPINQMTDEEQGFVHHTS
jgi:hypothetical protein